MAINIEYTVNIDSNRSNIVIFVSNLSQLKNVDFLPNVDFYLNNKKFLEDINVNQYVILSNTLTNDEYLTNIIISLIKPSSQNYIDLGSFFYSLFNSSDKINKDKVTFFFSNKLIETHKLIISDLVFGFCSKAYIFDKYKTIKHVKKSLCLYKIKKFPQLEYKINLLNSINFCKDLVSEPANILNPILYSKKCLELKKLGLKIKIFDKKQLKKIGMRSLLAVAQGSKNDPRVVVMEWNLKKNIKPTILVGKGVTFDSGGISLKQSNGMEEMIFDMGGSAVVVASMMNAALNNLKNSLVGIIGLVENMPDGDAQRPGDIVKSLSGKTIEVLNTDAEGRMVLADIITYIQTQYKPKQIIDFATLTGAIMIALGNHRAGLFSNNDKLSLKLEIAGNITSEKIWRLPLGLEYDKEINSSRADMKNIGITKYGGSIHAAQFIKRFIENDVPWAHLDIAGVAWTNKPGQSSFSKIHSPGATAFGVRLIDQFLKG